MDKFTRRLILDWFQVTRYYLGTYLAFCVLPGMVLPLILSYGWYSYSAELQRTSVVSFYAAGLVIFIVWTLAVIWLSIATGPWAKDFKTAIQKVRNISLVNRSAQKWVDSKKEQE